MKRTTHNTFTTTTTTTTTITRKVTAALLCASMVLGATPAMATGVTPVDASATHAAVAPEARTSAKTRDALDKARQPVADARTADRHVVDSARAAANARAKAVKEKRRLRNAKAERLERAALKKERELKKARAKRDRAAKQALSANKELRAAKARRAAQAKRAAKAERTAKADRAKAVDHRKARKTAAKENRKHLKRVAALNRIIALARRATDRELYEFAVNLLRKESRRHARVLKSLSV